MARRKNTRRFDPRYFMDEKTDIIKEEAEAVEEEIESLPHSRERMLREDLRNNLSKSFSKKDIDEIANFLLEGDSYLTGSGTMASEISDTDFETAYGKLEALGELFSWAVDWIPNLIQGLAKIPEAEVGPGIKSLRILSRIFGGPVKVIAWVVTKAAKAMQDASPEEREQIEAAMGRA